MDMKKIIIKTARMIKREYEAVKELLPTGLQEDLAVLERDISQFAKELALEFLKEHLKENMRDEEGSSVTKIDIDFT